jgi:hypothetical protein
MPDDFDQFNKGLGPDDLGRSGPGDLGDDPFASMVNSHPFSDRLRSKHSRRFLSVGLGFYGKLKSMKSKKKR